MKFTFLSISFWLMMLPVCVAQPEEESTNPYKINKKRDLTILGAGAVVNAVGFYIITSKDRLTPEQALAADKQNIPKFDRWSAGYYNPDAKLASDFLAYGSLTFPLILLADPKVREHKVPVYMMYLQTMAIEDAQFIFTAGLTNRKRPLVYGEQVPMEERTAKPNQNSFFAGHTAATAASCMFTAKIFNDFNPDSPWKPVVWGAAFAIPATVGYLRLEAGKHFLSDNLVGLTIGSLTGILVPEFHRKREKPARLMMVPVYSPYKGVNLSYML
ncbi:MAG: phosphatase PAP2 family protein [Chitinophagaceae bacterium]|nr:MAG: phosphatase PAP2 family protein [Chitinophagaceae bacterium]